MITKEKDPGSANLYHQNSDEQEEQLESLLINAEKLLRDLMASAKKLDIRINQSIAQTSECAANMQVSANAIIRLASDIGSIYSIVNAADIKSETYRQSETIHNITEDLAYRAESLSIAAMEASVLTSQVPSGTIISVVESINDTISKMLKDLSAS